MPLLEVESVRAGYGRIQILDGVSLSVEAGETVGVLGHNGMGKTTLLRTLIGEIPATAGRIAFDGQDATRWPTVARARARIGYVPQGRQIYPALSVRENLLMGVLLRRLDRAAEARALEAVLAEFPALVPLLERPGGALSGGEQQLLALARCLVGDPRLILLDEPTEGIQPSIIEEIAARLKDLKARSGGGLSLVLVEQNLDFIRALADRILIIQRGRITHELGPETLGDPELVGEFIGMGARAIEEGRR